MSDKGSGSRDPEEAEQRRAVEAQREAVRQLLPTVGWLLACVAVACVAWTFVMAASEPGLGVSLSAASARLYVTRDLPTDGTGLLRGDLLLELDGREAPDLGTVRDACAGAATGQPLDIRVGRPGTGLDVAMRYPADDLRDAGSWLDALPAGASVSGVEPGSRAWSAGLRNGDHLTSVGGVALDTPGDPSRWQRLFLPMVFGSDGGAPVVRALELVREHSAPGGITVGAWRAGAEEALSVASGTNGVTRDAALKLVMTCFNVALVFLLINTLLVQVRRPWVRLLLGSLPPAACLYLLTVLAFEWHGSPGLPALAASIAVLCLVLGGAFVGAAPGIRVVSSVVRSALIAGFATVVAWRLHEATSLDMELLRQQPQLADWLMTLRLKVFQPGQPSLLPMLMLGCFFFGIIHLVDILMLVVLPLRDRSSTDTPSARLLDRLRSACSRTIDVGERRKALDGILDDVEDRYGDNVAYVRWAEQALPLLGFLGTVIGIASALLKLGAVITSAVIFAPEGNLTPPVRESLDSAFSDMGFAFDTTFVGLAGVLVIGAIDLLVRRSYHLSFSQVRDQLDGELQTFGGTTASDQLAVLESTVQVAAGAVSGASRAAAAGLARATASGAARIAEGQDRMQAMLGQLVKDGNKEPFLEMRRVLYRTIVQLRGTQVGNAEKLVARLDKELGKGWTLEALGVPSGLRRTRTEGAEEGEKGGKSAKAEKPEKIDTTDLVVCAAAGKKRAIVRLSTRDDPGIVDVLATDTLAQVDLVLPDVSVRTGLVRAAAGTFSLLELVDGLPARAVASYAPNCLCLPFSFRGTSWVAQMGRAAGKLQLQLVHLESGIATPRERTNGVDWTCGDVEVGPEGVALHAIEQRPGLAVLHRLQLLTRQGSVVAASVPGTAVAHLPNRVVRRLACLGAGSVLALDSTNLLHYVDARGPVELERLPEAPQALLVSPRGWFAYVAAQHLCVRRIHGDLKLTQPPPPYQDALIGADAVDYRSWCTSADGRLILALGQQRIFAWTFPETSV